MAVSEDGEPDHQVQQAGVSPARNPARLGTAARQALHDQERRLLDQERRLVGTGSHAVDRMRATTAGTFWSKLNAW